MTAPRRPIPALLNDLQDRLILPGMLRFTKLGFAWRQHAWPPMWAALAALTTETEKRSRREGD